MSTGPSIADIKDALQARVGELARHLAPGGEEKAGVYTPLNPTRADRRPGSFVIWTTRGTAGAWKDYATGEQGDIIDLVGYCLGFGKDRAKTLDWCRIWTGLDRGQLPASQVQQRPRVDTAQAEATRRAKAARAAKAVWLEGQAELLGTRADTYFAQRGIDLQDLKRPPGALRYRNAWPYYTEAPPAPPFGSFPCILAAMQRGSEIVAVHQTWLAINGCDKAPVPDGYKARKVRGDAMGAFIPIARGHSDLSLREANENGIADTLVLTEGVEDALSVALSDASPRVWACYSLGNLAAIELPPCAHEVIIFADNDWGKPQAAQLLEKAVAALSAQGRAVRVARAAIGKDANDLLNAGG